METRHLWSIGAAVILLATSEVTAEPIEIVEWGLEKPIAWEISKPWIHYLYEDTSCSPRDYLGGTDHTEPDKPMYRCFARNEQVFVTNLLPYIDEAVTLYGEYLRGGGKPTREDFLAFLRSEHPNLLARLSDANPILFFDFVGPTGKQFILTDIYYHVEVFQDVAGGNIAEVGEEVAYFLPVSAEVGQGEMHITNNKLTVQGTEGRALLVLGPADFDPRGGVTKSGTYTMSVGFRFGFKEGDEEMQFTTVYTPTFKIDM